MSPMHAQTLADIQEEELLQTKTPLVPNKSLSRLMLRTGVHGQQYERIYCRPYNPAPVSEN